jgi:hypothetical protein
MARISDRDYLKSSLGMRGKCDKPLDEYLHTAVNFDLFFLAATKKEVRFTVANQIFYRSDIANWIIKLKINADFKHPKGKHAYKSKALADVYSAVFHACQALHTWGFANEYENAGLWFAAILYEFVLCRSDGSGKNECIEELREQNSSLTAIKNTETPKIYLPLDVPTRAQNTHALFKKLFTPIEDRNFDLMRINLLGKIIESMKAYVSWCDKNTVGALCSGGENQKDFATLGKGRGRKTLENVLIDFETLAAIGL